MTERQKERLVKQCIGLIKKCKKLDRAMSLSMKPPKDMTKLESKELRNLSYRLAHWCMSSNVD